jgi:hypothetical protein
VNDVAYCFHSNKGGHKHITPLLHKAWHQLITKTHFTIQRIKSLGTHLQLREFNVQTGRRYCYSDLRVRTDYSV